MLQVCNFLLKLLKKLQIADLYSPALSSTFCR